ncbi:hypothetical protein ACVOMV_29365 [Mesorhizobium atlanticum]
MPHGGTIAVRFAIVTAGFTVDVANHHVAETQFSTAAIRLAVSFGLAWPHAVCQVDADGASYRDGGRITAAPADRPVLFDDVLSEPFVSAFALRQCYRKR